MKLNKLKKNIEIFNTNLVYFIIVVLFVCLRICFSMDVFSFLGSSADLVLTLVTQVGLMFVLPLFLFSKLNKTKPRATLEDFSFKKANYKTVLISIAIGLIVFILNIAVSTFFSYILSLLGYHASTSSGTAVAPTWGNFFLSLLTVAILPAICEEFTHRGLLLSGYKKLGFKKAVILSALMFGLIHLNVNQFFYATVIGLVLAVVTLYSRSIVPAIIIHFMNNGINVYLEFAETKGIFGQNFYSGISSYLSNGSIFSNVIVIALLLTLLLFLLFILIGWLLKINAQKSLASYAENATLMAMREEVLSDIEPQEKKEVEKPLFPPLIFAKNSAKNTLSVKIPYEVLGFYMEPAIKPTPLDKLFFYATILLGSLITIFTFVWGVI